MRHSKSGVYRVLALYRKYRSRDFQELVGQDHVAKNLESALEKARISHAYLFTGPRGVGKKIGMTNSSFF